MLFREKTSAPCWLRGTGVAIWAFLVVMTGLVIPVLAKDTEAAGGLIALLVITFIVIAGTGLISVVGTITVAIDGNYLDAHLAPFRVMHVRLKDVTDVEVADLSARSAAGIGWRIVGRDQFVLWSAGPAVWLTLADGRRRVIRTDRADELSRTVLEAMTSASPAA